MPDSNIIRILRPKLTIVPQNSGKVILVIECPGHRLHHVGIAFDRDTREGFSKDLRAIALFGGSVSVYTSPEKTARNSIKIERRSTLAADRTPSDQIVISLFALQREDDEITPTMVLTPQVAVSLANALESVEGKSIVLS